MMHAKEKPARQHQQIPGNGKLLPPNRFPGSTAILEDNE